MLQTPEFPDSFLIAESKSKQSKGNPLLIAIKNGLKIPTIKIKR